MKKAYLFIIIFIAIVAFAATDYYVNTEVEEKVEIAVDTTVNDVKPPAEIDKNIIQELLDSYPVFTYKIAQRSRTNQLFESFDLQSLNSIKIYQNTLNDTSSNADPSTAIIIYEIHGDSTQGRMTYLSLKLKVIDQLSPTTNINEVSNLGNNAFFYNNINNKSTGYVLTQVKDNLYGFEYNKENDDSFNIVKNMIQSLSEMQI